MSYDFPGITGATGRIVSLATGLDGPDVMELGAWIDPQTFGPGGVPRILSVDGTSDDKIGLALLGFGVDEYWFFLNLESPQGIAEWGWPCAVGTSARLVSVSFDGSSLTNDPVLRENNSILTLSSDFNAASGSYESNSNAWQIGNRVAGSQQFDGTIARAFAVAGTLTAAERLRMFRGEMNDTIAAVDVLDAPLFDDLTENVGGTMSLTGTNQPTVAADDFNKAIAVSVPFELVNLEAGTLEVAMDIDHGTPDELVGPVAGSLTVDVGALEITHGAADELLEAVAGTLGVDIAITHGAVDELLEAVSGTLGVDIAITHGAVDELLEAVAGSVAPDLAIDHGAVDELLEAVGGTMAPDLAITHGTADELLEAVAGALNVELNIDHGTADELLEAVAGALAIDLQIDHGSADELLNLEAGTLTVDSAGIDITHGAVDELLEAVAGSVAPDLAIDHGAVDELLEAVAGSVAPDLAITHGTPDELLEPTGGTMAVELALLHSTPTDILGALVGTLVAGLPFPADHPRDVFERSTVDVRERVALDATDRSGDAIDVVDR